MPTALKLTDPAVFTAARHKALKGLKRIGCGAFAYRWMKKIERQRKK